MGCRVALGDVCSFYRGASVPRTRMYDKGAYLYIHYGDLYKGFDLHIDVEDPAKPIPYILNNEKIKDSQRLRDQDIVYVLTSETVDDLGHAYLFNNPKEKPTISGTETTIVRVNRRDLVVPAYLNYLMSSPRFIRELRQYTRGMKVFRVHPKDVARIEIDLPQTEVQHQIVSILDAIYAKQQANSKLNDYLAELIDTLFCELVLGALDLSNTVQFSSFLSERKEKCLSRTNPEYSVTDTGIHPRDSKFHKKLSAATSKNKILRKDDLVFGISRKILNWGLFEDEIGEVSSAYRVYSIRLLPPEYVARYIAHYQHAFTDIIKPSSREGQGIMPDALMAKTIPVLDEEAWNRYVQAVESIKEQIRIVTDESDALAELREALLPKLMSGEIDVSKVDLTQLNNHLA